MGTIFLYTALIPTVLRVQIVMVKTSQAQSETLNICLKPNCGCEGVFANRNSTSLHFSFNFSPPFYRKKHQKPRLLYRTLYTHHSPKYHIVAIGLRFVREATYYKEKGNKEKYWKLYRFDNILILPPLPLNTWVYEILYSVKKSIFFRFSCNNIITKIYPAKFHFIMD